MGRLCLPLNSFKKSSLRLLHMTDWHSWLYVTPLQRNDAESEVMIGLMIGGWIIDVVHVFLLRITTNQYQKVILSKTSFDISSRILHSQ